ncbi:MAG: FtsX-like permease family protein [Balneolaceae bacterium]|nr:FtsX-like permease family protein [Balneolaceae bacterium]
MEGGFPFYGELETQPASAARTYQAGRRALVDHTLMTQFGLQPGDSVKIGQVTFEIGRLPAQDPRQDLAISMVGPRIFIPKAWLDSTNLVQRGSRIDDNTVLPVRRGARLRTDRGGHDRFTEAQEPEYDLGYDTVEERQQELGEAVDNLGTFLNLVGFIALLLGGIGVASSIHVYITRKINTASVLRCFGASGRQVTGIFLIQALVLGFLGALAGALIGIGPAVYAARPLQHLPAGRVSFCAISWLAIGLGLLTGTGVALVFALLPPARPPQGLPPVRPAGTLEGIFITSPAPAHPLTGPYARRRRTHRLPADATPPTQSCEGRRASPSAGHPGWRFGLPLRRGAGCSYAAGEAPLPLLLALCLAQQGLANLYRPNDQTSAGAHALAGTRHAAWSAPSTSARTCSWASWNSPPARTPRPGAF